MENGKKGVRGSNFAARGSKLVVFHFGNKLVSVFSACERDGTEKNGVFSMFNVGFGGNFGANLRNFGPKFGQKVIWGPWETV